jgi:hypothetical protein
MCEALDLIPAPKKKRQKKKKKPLPKDHSDYSMETEGENNVLQ